MTSIRALALRASDSRAAASRADDVRREGPGHVVSADRAAAAAGGCTERARRPARRRRVRRLRAPSAVRRRCRPLSGCRRGGLPTPGSTPTALCAPTRAALLSGRNHHSVGMGMITETATSAPGSSGVRPNTKAALATTLKLNGYSTAQFGKCHEVPPWQTSPVGPFDAWPSGGGGFETSTASSAARTTSTTRPSTTAPPRSSRRRPPRRATTSPRT